MEETMQILWLCVRVRYCAAGSASQIIPACPQGRRKGENMQQNLLAEYARLVARVGINVQKGQTIVVSCPVDCAPFGRQLARAAYDTGAKDVVMSWTDDFCAREHWLRADDSLFDAVYPWDALRSEQLAREGAGFISVSGSDPENLRGVDPDRLRRYSAATGRDLRTYYRMMTSSAIAWCVVSVPTAAWARKVFPGRTDDEAVELLWDKILAAVRIAPDTDAVAAWQAHCAALEARAAALNAQRFVSLHYKSALGTDAVVRLPQNHVWLAGADRTPGGVRFVANMPTEEVFTAPLRDGTDGVLAASKPLVLSGNLVTGIRLTLRKGRIVEAHADSGEDVLQKALDTDEGARYLGEVALVPSDSPIAQSGLLYCNTLFDENAACHFAFGEAYPGCVRGGEGMDEGELLTQGINADSCTHVDFMIGTDDLCITGTTQEGCMVPVFENGRFVL